MIRLFVFLFMLLNCNRTFAQDVYVQVKNSSTTTDSGAGVCFKVSNNKSYVLTCSHLYTTKLETKVQYNNKNYKAMMLKHSPKHDLALVEVQGTLAVALLAKDDPKPDTIVTHEGPTSGPSKGKVLPYRTEFLEPKSLFNSTLTAISGDSGSAVYNENKEVVALLLGRTDQPETSPMRGVPISKIREFLKLCELEVD